MADRGSPPAVEVRTPSESPYIPSSRIEGTRDFPSRVRGARCRALGLRPWPRTPSRLHFRLALRRRLPPKPRSARRRRLHSWHHTPLERRPDEGPGEGCSRSSCAGWWRKLRIMCDGAVGTLADAPGRARARGVAQVGTSGRHTCVRWPARSKIGLVRC